MTDLERELEHALTVLASPISWQWFAHQSGNGYWLGEHNGVSYQVAPPLAPDEVDTYAFNRKWRLVVNMPRNYRDLTAWAHTAQDAKALCVRHAVSGDFRELQTLIDTQQARAKWYVDTEAAALDALQKIYSRRENIPSLRWQPPETQGETKPRLFCAESQRGTYAVSFVPERRWVVVFQPNHERFGTEAVERCFLTWQIVKMACALHARSARWVGTLPLEGAG